VRARRGVVVAAGVWSGRLLADATGVPAWQQLLQPRRGHLVELMPPPGMPPLHSGMMELGYTQHYSAHRQQQPQPASGGGGSSSGDGNTAADAALDVTFTATVSAAGSLLVGSSREFCGWECTPSAAIVGAIMRRAATFLPHLDGLSAEALADTTRVGLRPYAQGGLPAVGPVPGLPGVVVAAGHEGSGLCLGPATAEVVVQCLGLAGVSLGGELAAAAQALLPERRLAALLPTAAAAAAAAGGSAAPAS
jgi:glycine/D-amino acid oxidase-like deaminating enzyme